MLFCILSIIAISSCLLGLLRDSFVKDGMYLNNKNKPSYKKKKKKKKKNANKTIQDNEILHTLIHLSAIHPFISGILSF